MLFDVPKSVVTYLIELICNYRLLAYILVKKDGKIASWGGNLADYGVRTLTKGINASQQIFFLEGLLPLEDDTSVYIPRVKTDEGICADLHLFSSPEGDWVILLDASLDEMQMSLIQQDVNNKMLAREKVAQVLNNKNFGVGEILAKRTNRKPKH